MSRYYFIKKKQESLPFVYAHRGNCCSMVIDNVKSTSADPQPQPPPFFFKQR